MSRDELDGPMDPDTLMAEALKALSNRGFRALKRSRYHLKVGPFNFYPGRGTIFRDGDQRALDKRGLTEFTNMLERLRKPPSLHII